MIKVGITGQNGFIGYHLFNTLSLYNDDFRLINFERDFFLNPDLLDEFVSSCDVIFHLAALNRHNDPKIIYQINIDLVKKLICACERTDSVPHIIFSSSIQEDLDNLYGQSKRGGRLLFEEWAIKNNAKFSAFLIPNVFGPFGNPYYNSVIATFCHQLTHKERPSIISDSKLNLIYIDELIKFFLNHLKEDNINITFKKVSSTSTISVSMILQKLESFADIYFSKGIIPNLAETFDKNLFITFLSYISYDEFYPVYLSQNIDNRGRFVEILRLNSGGQVSFSTTGSGVVRGNHFHTRKVERFAVILGVALVELRKIGTNEKLSFIMNGEKPCFIDIPVWHTHNIQNIGSSELLTIFWINEFYDSSDSDTFFINV